MTTSQDTTVRQRTSPKALRTRARLLAASREVFERDGFIEARVTDIATAAGVSHGTFYTYFPSKESIFTSLILSLVHDFGSPSGALPTADARVAYRAILKTNREYALMIRANAKLMAVWRQAATVNQELADLLHEEDQRVIERAERGIRRLQEMGLADPPDDARYLARALGGMVKEFCGEVFSRGLDFDLERSAAALTRIWALGIGLPVPDDVDELERSVRDEVRA